MTAPERVADRLRGIPPPVFTVDSDDSEYDGVWKVFVRYAPHQYHKWLADFKYEVDAKIFQAMKTDAYKNS